MGECNTLTLRASNKALDFSIKKRNIAFVKIARIFHIGIFCDVPKWMYIKKFEKKVPGKVEECIYLRVKNARTSRTSAKSRKKILRPPDQIMDPLLVSAY